MHGRSRTRATNPLRPYLSPFARLVRLAGASVLLLSTSCRRAPQASLAAEMPAGELSTDAWDSGSAEPDQPLVPARPALVDLHGHVAAPAPIAETGPRLASIAMLTDIRLRPTATAPTVGYLRAGTVVEVEPGERGTSGCPGGFRRIRPYGFVCIGPEATLDLEHPIVRAATRRPDITQKLPYMYGIATSAGPAYGRIPSDSDLKSVEPHLKSHLAKWASDKESGAAYGLDVWMKWRNDAPPPLEALANRTTTRSFPGFCETAAPYRTFPES